MSQVAKASMFIFVCNQKRKLVQEIFSAAFHISATIAAIKRYFFPSFRRNLKKSFAFAMHVAPTIQRSNDRNSLIAKPDLWKLLSREQQSLCGQLGREKKKFFVFRVFLSRL